MTLSGSSANRKIVAFFSIFYLVAWLVYWFRPLGDASLIPQTVVYLLAPLFAAVSSFFLTTTYGLSGRKSVIFFSLCVGLSLLFAGEVLFVYYDVFLQERPFPTIADALYLLSYPFLFLSLMAEIRSLWGTLSQSSNREKVSLLFLFLALLVIGGYFGIYLAFDSAEPFLNNLISIAYGVADLFLIAGSIMLFYLTRRTRLTAETYFWTGIAAGFSSITAADILFANFNELYLAGNSVAVNTMDSLWMLGYTVIAFSLANLSGKLRQSST